MGSGTRCARVLKIAISITPPIKPYLEEKMWFALFGCSRYANSGTRIRREIFRQATRMIPYSWLLDPTPLPQHGSFHAWRLHDWREAARFSQRDRDLLLKVSGFSPLGWGSRGIALGADLPHAEWEKRINHALATSSRCRRLCNVSQGRLVDHQYWILILAS